MKDGGFRKASRPISSHLITPVLNGLSDLLRLPQYPVLGVRAAAPSGVRREGELYTQAHAGGKRRAAPAQDGHKSGNNRSLGDFPGLGGWPACSLRTARSLEAARARSAVLRPSPIMA